MRGGASISRRKLAERRIVRIFGGQHEKYNARKGNAMGGEAKTAVACIEKPALEAAGNSARMVSAIEKLMAHALAIAVAPVGDT